MKRLNNLKWFAIGVSACLIISLFVIPVIAASTQKQATLYYSDIKITLDGKQITPRDANGTEVEPFVIDGTTYLPVRGIAGAVGLNVSWDENTKTVALTSPGYAPSPVKYNRTNPAPVGTAQTVTIDSFMGKHTVSMVITEVTRGNAAWDMIKSANRFNSGPDDGKEYVLAKVKVTVMESQDDKAVNFYSYSLTPFSSNNVEYKHASVVIPEPNLSGDVYAGGTLEGYIVFSVDKTDATPKAVYGANYDGTGGAWFSLVK